MLTVEFHSLTPTGIQYILDKEYIILARFASYYS